MSNVYEQIRNALTRQPDEMLYDGITLEWAGHGTYQASSGRSEDPFEEAHIHGVIPEGLYEVSLAVPRPWKSAKFAEDTSMIRHPYNHPSHWGCHRVRLQKIRLNNPKCEYRDNFSIHDSRMSANGPAGCIQVEPLFFKQLIAFADEQRRPGGVKTLKLTVAYSAEWKKQFSEEVKIADDMRRRTLHPPKFRPLRASP